MLPPITMMWHLLARFGWDLKPTSKMLIGFLVTGGTMAVIAGRRFTAPAASSPVRRRPSSGPRKRPPRLPKLLPRNEAAETAAQEAHRRRDQLRQANAEAKQAKTDAKIKAAEDAKRAAKAELEAVGERVKKTSPEAVTVMCARNAALDALRTAQAAFDSASPGKKRSIEEMTKQIEANAEAAQLAAEATNKAKDLAVAADRDNAEQAKPRRASTMP